jgi:hypothetical protein
MLFAAGWVPFAGIFIGLIGFPEGSYAWEELPTITRYSMIATGITFGFSMAALFGAPLVSWWTNHRVLRSGQTVEAVVLEIWDTGTTINQNPIVRFQLDVHPPGGVPFIAETERLVSRLKVQAYQPGVKVRVRYDPDSKEVAFLED